MIYVILTVVASVFLLTAFKLFDVFKINTFHAIIVNYFTAAVTGYVFSKEDIAITEIHTHSWIILCLPLGFLFISVFYLISLTTQRISITAASVANKMSVVLPVLFSVFIIGDEFNFMKLAGVLLALAAVYLTTSSPKKTETNETQVQWWLPVLVFIGSGCIDISINAAKQYFLKTQLDEELFGICTFASAFCIGLLFLIFQLFASRKSIKNENLPRTIAAGIILGIPNYFSIFFIIKALDSGIFTSAELFPILNISNVVLSALVGVLLFKEKLSAMNGFGIALAIASIGLITL